MRVLNVLRNSIYSIVSFIFISLLTIFVRKQFTQYLSVELLGLEGLFSNIISILSLAELGVSSIINYSLYKALAENDRDEINIIMNIYRYLYRIVGFIVLFISIGLYFYLPAFIEATEIPWSYVQFVYILQIFTILSTYFIAYKRSLYIADQKDYKCIRVDTICKSLDNTLKIIAIVFFKNYILYAASTLIFNILANLIISNKVSKEYLFLKPVKITIKEIKRRKFFKDIKNLMVHKLAGILYGGSDSIIVTCFLGLKTAGLMSNYLLIHAGIYSILIKCFQGIIPSIGNMIYSESHDKSVRMYRMLDMFYSFIGSYIFSLYFLFLQPFIGLFFGKEYLLPDSYAVLLSINVFLAMQFENACNYRNTYGSYEKDRFYMVLSAVSKIFIALMLISRYGICGVIAGTIVGLWLIIYGRIIIVYRYILKENIKSYLLKHTIFSFFIIFLVLVIKEFIGYFNFPLTYGNLLLQCLFTFCIMFIIQSLIFYKTQEYQDIVFYLKNILNIIKSKVNIR